MAAIRFLVIGRVQGVGFRNHVQRTAGDLGVRGWVRNLRDGTLEIAAAGSPAALDKLERGLHHGPPSSRVDRLQRFAWPHAESDLGRGTGFHIRE